MAENGPVWNPLFDPQSPPEKVYVGPFWRPFPGNEAHKLFSGGPKLGVSGGGLKVYVEKFMCFSVPYFGVSCKVTRKVIPKVTFRPEKPPFSHFCGQKVTF